MARHGPKAFLCWPLAIFFASSYVQSGYSHSCGLICGLEEILCSGITHSTNTNAAQLPTTNTTNTTNTTIIHSLNHTCNLPRLLLHLLGIHTAKSYYKFFKTNSTSASLHLNKGRASKVFHSSFQELLILHVHSYFAFLLLHLCLI